MGGLCGRSSMAVFHFDSLFGSQGDRPISVSDKDQAQPWGQHDGNPGNKYKE